MDIELSLLLPVAVSVGLGVLVGLQREVVDEPVGGIRTYPLLALVGALAAILDGRTHPSWAFATGLLVCGAFLLLGKWSAVRNTQEPVGLTGAVAGVAVYLLGGLAVGGHLGLAVVAGGAIAVVLHVKPVTHDLVDRITSDEMRAIMQLAAFGLVVLPLLPDRTYGPYQVLNPFETWLMVVLIVGLNLLGYVALRWLGPRSGALIGGGLGGLASSTATTASYARQSRTGLPTPLAALAIMLASTVLFGRVFIEVGAVSRQVLAEVAAPLGVLLGVHVVIVLLGWWWAGRRVNLAQGEPVDTKNPAQLGSALAFGVLYSVIKLGVAAAEEELGESGLFAVAVISGLTDVDAVTLSSAQLASAGRLEPDTAWRVIVTAAVANLVFKAGMAFALGGRALGWAVLRMFALAAAAAVALMLLWPG